MLQTNIRPLPSKYVSQHSILTALLLPNPVQVVSTNLVSFNFRSDPDVSSMEEVDENRRSSRRKSLVATKSNPDMREETPRGRRVS